MLRTGVELPRSNATLEDILAESSISTFGTSSLRRIAQLRARSANVVVKDVRGNINTRLSKLDNHDEHGYDCLVMATSGLVRGGFEHRISLRLENWYHAVSQGALGVECRMDDTLMLTRILAPLSLMGRKAMLECMAERVLMKCLEGGCSVPIGVRTYWNSPSNLSKLTLEAIVLSIDGSQRVEARLTQQLLEPLPNDESNAFSLSDFTYVPVFQFDSQLQVQICNCVLLGRKLAQRMIDIGVKDVLATITKEKELL